MEDANTLGISKKIEKGFITPPVKYNNELSWIISIKRKLKADESRKLQEQEVKKEKLETQKKMKIQTTKSDLLKKKPIKKKPLTTKKKWYY